MTVLCIAHRVRTIVKADRIFYLESGVVKEQGTFRELNYFKNIEMPPDEEMPYEEMLDELRPWKQLSKEESMREQVVVKEL
jgi:ABC-type methionine transport system ATPase subunit